MLAQLASPIRWVASPFKMFGEAVADILVPDPTAPVNLAIPASPKQRSPMASVPKKRAPNNNSRAAAKRPAPAAEKRSKAVRVKQEPLRSMPRRGQRSAIKSGFYSESNLQSLAYASAAPASHRTHASEPIRTCAHPCS